MVEFKRHITRAFALFMVFVMAIAFSPVAAKVTPAKKVSINLKFKNKNDFKNKPMKCGETRKIKATVSTGKINYTSNRTKVAEVHKDKAKVFVLAVAPGKAKIKLQSDKDKSVSVSFYVTVDEPEINNFAFQHNEYYYEFEPDEPDDPNEVVDTEPDDEPDEPDEPEVPGEDDEFIEWNQPDDTEKANYYIVTKPAQVAPANYHLYFTFSSSDPTVASIDEKGVIKVLKNGETTITATLKEGDFSKNATQKQASMKLIIAVPPEEPDDEGEETE